MSESQTKLTLVHLYLDDARQFRLAYNGLERAAAALTATTEAVSNLEVCPVGEKRIQFDDDYGTRLVIDPTMLSAYLLVEPHKEIELNAELALLNARANAKLQKRAQSDPELSGPQLVTGTGSPLSFPNKPV